MSKYALFNDLPLMEHPEDCCCLICPNCGAHEVAEFRKGKKGNPVPNLFNIRAFRVDDSSECLSCGSWF